MKVLHPWLRYTKRALEFQLSLPIAGTVEAVSVEPGLQVKNRQLLVQVRPGD